MADIPRRESLTAFDAAFSSECVARVVGKDTLAAADAAKGPAEVLPAEAGVAEAVLAVAEHGCVRLAGSGRVVDRVTMDSMVFRAWLFGVLTFLEIRARELIASDPAWRELMSRARLEKARAIKDERARRGRSMETLDALQFGDVGWLAVRYDGWYEYFGVRSKKKAKLLVKQLETLRNALAHSQDILSHDWETVVAVARSVVAIKEAETAARIASTGS
ncbi:MAG: hypothetical protein JSW71_15195 [Gemmatimonadota bacterium]|nr:MAG: hypothetical protein JSW71_15195 [Gemmatimonadota bacterium]